MNVRNLNATLSALQDDWIEKLPRMTDDCDFTSSQNFSEPFAFGVSDCVIRSGLPRLMYIGEEARNWSGFAEKTQKYRQGWAVAYLEHQLYGKAVSEDAIRFTEALTAKDRDSMKRNGSAFWSLLREIAGERYAPCWNNLDKLHRVVSGSTRPLTYWQERALHGTYPREPGVSLLLEEIRLTQPQVVLFMGSAYGASMEWALGLPSGSLATYRPNAAAGYVSEVNPLPACLPSSVKRMIWIYHPAYIRRRGAMQAVAAGIERILSK